MSDIANLPKTMLEHWHDSVRCCQIDVSSKKRDSVLSNQEGTNWPGYCPDVHQLQPHSAPDTCEEP